MWWPRRQQRTRSLPPVHLKHPDPLHEHGWFRKNVSCSSKILHIKSVPCLREEPLELARLPDMHRTDAGWRRSVAPPFCGSPRLDTGSSVQTESKRCGSSLVCTLTCWAINCSGGSLLTGITPTFPLAAFDLTDVIVQQALHGAGRSSFVLRYRRSSVRCAIRACRRTTRCSDAQRASSIGWASWGAMSLESSLLSQGPISPPC
jgi:hypothetical protein